jgi:hypothetical protein
VLSSLLVVMRPGDTILGLRGQRSACSQLAPPMATVLIQLTEIRRHRGERLPADPSRRSDRGIRSTECRAIFEDFNQIGTLTYDVCATTLHIDHLSPERLESIEKSPSVTTLLHHMARGKTPCSIRIRENRGRESGP